MGASGFVDICDIGNWAGEAGELLVVVLPGQMGLSA